MNYSKSHQNLPILIRAPLKYTIAHKMKGIKLKAISFLVSRPTRDLIRAWPVEAKNDVEIRKRGLMKHKKKKMKSVLGLQEP